MGVRHGGQARGSGTGVGHGGQTRGSVTGVGYGDQTRGSDTEVKHVLSQRDTTKYVGLKM